MKIISGGQTGVDRAALDAALALEMEIGGWCPAGRTAEEEPIPAHYPLQETPSRKHAERTEWNVRDSDATLILTWGPPVAGTRLTAEFCKDHFKPVLVIDMSAPQPPDQVAGWVLARNVKVLNVAGPRESFQPGQVYALTRPYLEAVFRNLHPDS